MKTLIKKEHFHCFSGKVRIFKSVTIEYIKAYDFKRECSLFHRANNRNASLKNS